MLLTVLMIVLVSIVIFEVLMYDSVYIYIELLITGLHRDNVSV